MSGTPSQSQNQRKNSGIWLGPTVGKSSPKNSRRGCLCLDGRRYSRSCCDGFLANQGIGKTQSPSAVGTVGGFSNGFSDGFERLT
jgi:hypothetical protein